MDHGLTHNVTAPRLSPAGWLGAAGRWLRRDALALCLFVAVGLAVVWPALPAPTTRVLGPVGDNVPYVYMVGRVAQAIRLGQSPLFDPELNYPDGLALASNDLPYLALLAAAPVTWLVGPAASYNLIVLASYVLSGYVVYLWLRALSLRPGAAALAGLAFMLAPYTLAHSYGHLNLVPTYVLPLFFWALDAALGPDRPPARGLLLLGGAALLVGGTSQYYLVICLLAGACYALLRAAPRWAYLLRQGWKLAASVAAGSGLSALPYLLSLGGGNFNAYTLEEVRLWSADPLNFVLPARLHPLWGAWVDRLRPEPLWVEKTLYVGAAALLLAVAALLWRRAPARAPRLVWLGTALFAAVLALGTDLHIGGQPLQGREPLWLPASYVSLVPLLNLMRVWSRFGVVTLLFVAMLAGVGADVLAGAARRWAGPTLAALGVLVLLDLLPGTLPTTQVGPSAADLWLARQPGDFAVAVLPPGADNRQTLLGSLWHSKPQPAFIHPKHMPPAFRQFFRRGWRFPEQAAVDGLRQMGFRYLLLRRAAYDGKDLPDWGTLEAHLRQSPDLRIVADLGDVVIVAFQ